MFINQKNIFLFFIFFNALKADLPKISIITSIYKGKSFIEGFLKDITRQTIFNKCELLLIDANSPDNEYLIISEYQKKYPNIIYTRLEADPGLYGVWNLGVQMAKGEYITNANLDDRVAPNCYEEHLKALNNNPEIDLVYSDIYITTAPNETFDKNSAHLMTYFREFSKENMICCMPNNHPMWRKSLHEKYGLFDTKYKSIGDYEMWLRAIDNGSKFLKINLVLGLLYHNPEGLSIITRQNEKIEVCEKYKHLFNLSHLAGSEILNLVHLAWVKSLKKI